MVVFAERIQKAKRTKFELELIKVVDCFLDFQGVYDSNSVPLKIKPVEQTIFFDTNSRITQRIQKAS